MPSNSTQPPTGSAKPDPSIKVGRKILPLPPSKISLHAQQLAAGSMTNSTLNANQTSTNPYMPVNVLPSGTQHGVGVQMQAQKTTQILTGNGFNDFLAIYIMLCIANFDI
jgi:hypothetical protein